MLQQKNSEPVRRRKSLKAQHRPKPQEPQTPKPLTLNASTLNPSTTIKTYILSPTWRFMGTYKQGHKCPNMFYKYSYPTYDPT